MAARATRRRARGRDPERPRSRARGGGARLVAGALLAASAAILPASAGPPFTTDDPEPVEKGHGEFYVASQDTWAADGSAGTLPHLELNYGPVRDVQLHVIVPLAWARPEGGKAARGLGDTEVGVKWRPVHEDGPFRGCPQVGTFVLVLAPTGDADRGLGSGHAQVFLPVWLQKSWGAEERPWTTYGGGGYWIRRGEGNRDSWFVGWLLERRISRSVTLGGELYHATPEADGEPSRTAFSLGGQWNLSEAWHALVSAGRDLEGPNRLAVYAAAQLTF